MTEPFADYINSGGGYKLGDSWGIINIKTGKIVKKPFVDRIYSDGTYLLNGEEKQMFQGETKRPLVAIWEFKN